MNGDAVVYSNVGLADTNIVSVDELPIYLDRDNDLITNDRDLCANSLSSEMKNIYGCAFNDSAIEQIERYSGFEFSGNELSSDGEDKFKMLLGKLEEYPLKEIKFTVLSNVQDDSLSSEEIKELSLSRAQLIKEELVNAGALIENVSIVSNAESSKMFLDDEERNNRVDIVVTKLKK